MTLDQARHIYFLGIGGMGMSALAWFFHEQGKIISGYDLNESRVTNELIQAGIPVYFTQDPRHLEEVDWVIYTPAIPSSHLEYQEAIAKGMPVYKRAEILGLLSLTYKTLAIAGTHGKTTTSAMLTHLMRSCGVSATAFLGGISHNLGSNYVYGNSEYAIMEADEYDRSFLQLQPSKALITALEADHLDIYGTEEELQNAYFEFAEKTSSDQPLLIHESLMAYPWKRSCITYGIEAGDYQAQNIRHDALAAYFDFVGEGIHLSDIHLPMPGAHNVSNLTGALTLCHLLGLDPAGLKDAAKSFSGIYRRFDVQVHTDSFTYIDDYAHHPTEVNAAIDTVRNLFPKRKVWVLFQPHLYSRTQDHAEGFARALDKADRALLLDIYPAREEPIVGVDSGLIRQLMNNSAARCISKNEILQALSAERSESIVLLSLGAGDIDKEIHKIKNWLEDQPLS
ncbi:MAG: UDP-N-acetylmuramate--L-alanine ligase [Bacteroidota bacterium]